MGGVIFLRPFLRPLSGRKEEGKRLRGSFRRGVKGRVENGAVLPGAVLLGVVEKRGGAAWLMLMSPRVDDFRPFVGEGVDEN
jgi:hypothetical protein